MMSSLLLAGLLKPILNCFPFKLYYVLLICVFSFDLQTEISEIKASRVYFSLTKDMTGREDIYRAPAIRALCCIIDGSMLQAIERYMKQVCHINYCEGIPF